MAICVSGVRFDNDSYYITTVNEETVEATIIGEMNGEPVEFTMGGGSSDFSTAEMTIVNTKALPATSITIAVVFVEDEYMYPAFVSRAQSTDAISAVLYKGVAHIDISSLLEGSEISVSGNAEIITEESYTFIVVTGDCTITISGGK